MGKCKLAGTVWAQHPSYPRDDCGSADYLVVQDGEPRAVRGVLSYDAISDEMRRQRRGLSDAGEAFDGEIKGPLNLLDLAVHILTLGWK